MEQTFTLQVMTVPCNMDIMLGKKIGYKTVKARAKSLEEAKAKAGVQ